MCDEKLERLKATLLSMGRVAVAYSGGVDSALLLRMAREVLADDAVAIMNVTPLVPPGDEEGAVQTARSMGVEPIIIRSDPLAVPDFRRNAPDRCYVCKRVIFTAIASAARDRGIDLVIDGSHVDDLSEDRPGLRALAELGVRSPLKEAGMGKEDVRRLAARFSLPCADKPSGPCLATRIPFGRAIDMEALRTVGDAEHFLIGLGFRTVRVRHHGAVARIEVPVEDIPALVGKRQLVVERLNQLGFAYVTMDLGGFRSGSMSETLGRRTGTDRPMPPE
ncbi:MAG TPA: ATP-dependent sacrificial sulfur transferase LarE [Methanomassiliicoccaceae archaeon]|nr:ATP-dependent sacrificial sulfur transferase LarE [Methanomassiliicoccaceae archaeon]HOK27817.1 ATP-dependent sacrificial sulfur transferase LarE [Methanomassiliicoccaceae archaeon]HOL07453.1 ATP-dependent sacrificial sulfur transferase LarE [Methanomassiliicoccaceae archaeon]HOQ26448.1 ATP-dependent sacrificial sulfur transferase LarE [Methanomassiliicoccaceae archaeon]HPP44988.1 ATP-dependent sacrificial sulfur transferase LarE [Methanomassiliicoccaceae archaeon]